MEARDIEHYLSLLGEELEALGVRTTFRLLMIGGGFMLTQVGNRTFTSDVDVLVYDRSQRYDTDDYIRFKSAVHLVAASHNLDEAWLSDKISDFLENAGPVPKAKLWRKFGSRLRVYIPPKGFILAHKLQAGRRKDWEDIEALLHELGVTTRAKALKLVDRYITNDDIKYHSELQKMLDRFFPVS
ncbi:MAG TPA: hypothetical protein VKR06_34030 [Ktedonosporobacter sp.]|nr:hypothetical protein [Ktedonosporobacter sp.]